MKCNHIAVKDVVSQKVASHHFKIDSRLKTSETGVKEMFERMFHNDFSEMKQLQLKIIGNIGEISREDKKFLKILETGAKKNGNHFEVPLPFKDTDVKLPNNRNQAVRGINHLKQRFQSDSKFFEDYKKNMGELLEKGYTRKSKKKANDGRLWYFPHRGVRHPSKPGKVRIVFECSVNFGGAFLNNKLLSGPDLTSQLAGVLLQFRSGEVAFIGDIEAMFYQVQVPDNQRGFLRHLWWENNNLEGDLVDYEMCVHVFVGSSSPGCCNYALRKTAVDNASDFNVGVAETLMNNFYIDDLVNSVESEDSAILLIQDVRKICQHGGFNLTKFSHHGGFNLTKFTSNRKGVLKSVPENHRKDGVKNRDLDGKLPEERALGICLDTEKDTFKFRIDLKEKPMTQRGMLSIVSSVYDTLGFVATFILKGKRLLQLLCQDEIGWDERVDDSIINKWLIWQKSLKDLEGCEINKCFKPSGFGQIKEIWLHHFSDASEEGYGQVSYLRMVNTDEMIHCCFLASTARLIPKKFVSMPCLEQVAAVLSVKVANFLKKELKIDCFHETYWSDSKVVLGYIRNNAKKFKIFVANKIQQIQEHSEVEQWTYVPTKINPADYASHGLSATSLHGKSSR